MKMKYVIVTMLFTAIATQAVDFTITNNSGKDIYPNVGDAHFDHYTSEASGKQITANRDLSQPVHNGESITFTVVEVPFDTRLIKNIPLAVVNTHTMVIGPGEHYSGWRTLITNEESFDFQEFRDGLQKAEFIIDNNLQFSLKSTTGGRKIN